MQAAIGLIMLLFGLGATGSAFVGVKAANLITDQLLKTPSYLNAVEEMHFARHYPKVGLESRLDGFDKLIGKSIPHPYNRLLLGAQFNDVAPFPYGWLWNQRGWNKLHNFLIRFKKRHRTHSSIEIKGIDPTYRIFDFMNDIDSYGIFTENSGSFRGCRARDAAHLDNISDYSMNLEEYLSLSSDYD